MGYQIMVDSCGDFSEQMKMCDNIVSIALRIQIDEEEIVDDERLNIKRFMEKLAGAIQCPQSSCPSPGQYIEAYDESADRTYIITGSSALTGSYNSACLARDMLQEEHPNANICVIDSRTASAGQALLTMKLIEWEERGLSFEKIQSRIREYVKHIKTRFVLESLRMLEKSGRLSGLKAKLAHAFNIFPILGATREGTICQTGQARGAKKALAVLIKQITEDCRKKCPGRLVISQCNCPERAMELKRKIKERYPNLEIMILPTKGISSMYAGEGGIVVSY